MLQEIRNGSVGISCRLFCEGARYKAALGQSQSLPKVSMAAAGLGAFNTRLVRYVRAKEATGLDSTMAIQIARASRLGPTNCFEKVLDACTEYVVGIGGLSASTLQQKTVLLGQVPPEKIEAPIMDTDAKQASADARATQRHAELVAAAAAAPPAPYRALALLATDPNAARGLEKMVQV